MRLSLDKLYCTEITVTKQYSVLPECGCYSIEHNLDMLALSCGMHRLVSLL
jgi:hypothetical protein